MKGRLVDRDRQNDRRLSQTLGNGTALREGRVSKDGVEFAPALEGGTYISGGKPGEFKSRELN